MWRSGRRVLRDEEENQNVVKWIEAYGKWKDKGTMET